MNNIRWYEVKYQHKTDISKTIRYEYPIEYKNFELQETLKNLYSIIVDDLNELSEYYLVDIRTIK